MDFFKLECQEAPINVSEFGLCDDQNGTIAYTSIDDNENWIATVKNASNKSLTFTAIDKCVIADNEERGRGRCDGMLISAANEHIYFVELKVQRGQWIPKAVAQLESTIQFFIENHDIKIYKHKKAFACNKKHPHFRSVENADKLRFFRNYGVRIDVQAKVIVV